MLRFIALSWRRLEEHAGRQVSEDGKEKVMRKLSTMELDGAMAEEFGESEAGVPDSMNYAVVANRRYSVQLGWQNYYDEIVRLLGFTNSTPNETLFVQSVARWQAEQYIWPVDGMIGPTTWAHMSAALGLAPATTSPGVAPAPPQSPPSKAPAWVHQLAPLLTRYGGDIPLPFLLGWIAVESGGRLEERTRLDERGYFQIHPGESQALHLDHPRLSTDPDYSIQGGIKLVRYRAAQARRLGFPEGTELFWRATKWRHWVPGAVDVIVQDMRKGGVNPVSWDVIKQYVAANRNRLMAVFKARFGGTWDPMVGIANVDKVFQRGNQLAASLSAP
jgi:hypothetical protein